MPEYQHPQDDVIADLVAQGQILPEDLEVAQRAAAEGGHVYGASYYLVKANAIRDPMRFSLALAERFGYPAVDLGQVTVEESAATLIQRDLAVEVGALPIRLDGSRLHVAMVNPADISAIDGITFATNGQFVIEPLVMDEFSLREEIDRQYGERSLIVEDSTDESVIDEGDFGVSAEAEDRERLVDEEVAEKPVVKFLNRMLTQAIQRGASDIHFEFYEKEGVVRFRIDGMLQRVGTIARAWEKTLTARVKLSAKMDTSQRRVPQDGSLRYRVSPTKVVDFRVSTLPTLWGEKTVLRVLDKSATRLELESLGVPEAERDALDRALARPSGMIIVTGPTGSGKTTTLYSMLLKAKKPHLNCLTVEDPVEYEIEGVNQVQVRAKPAMTFGAALKAFLRQDPDIIMVGEMRDKETAEIGFRAALTGHMLLTSMHTTSAAQAFTRLLDLGIDRFNLASATSVVIAQRLLKRLCLHCAAPASAAQYPVGVLTGAGLAPDDVARLKVAIGCPKCDQSGYRGRAGIYEVLPVTPEIAELVLKQAPDRDIETAAVAAGMTTLRRAAVNLALAGTTSLDEAMRVS